VALGQAAVHPAAAAATLVAAKPAVAPPAESIRVVCNKCHAAMRISLAVLRGKTSIKVRCPQCQIVMALHRKAAPTAAVAETGSLAAAARAADEETASAQPTEGEGAE
jgi:predicted Zn finger-like uncharacterized protein